MAFSKLLLAICASSSVLGEPARAGVPAPGLAVETVGRERLSRLPRRDELIVANESALGMVNFRLRSTSAELPPLPLGSNLTAHALGTVYGVEERCSFKQDGVFHLVCAAGVKPAGLVITFPKHRAPRGSSIALEVRGVGSGGILGQALSGGRDADKPSLLASGITQMPISTLSGGKVQLVLIAPSPGGEFLIKELVVSGPSRKHVLSNSAWAWSSSSWMIDSDRLLQSARDLDLQQLFITLVIEEDHLLHGDLLGLFVRRARQQGLAIVAVEGAPEMVQPAGLSNAMARARAIAAYQASANPEAQLEGVQYDIEPYTLPNWQVHGGPSYEDWADALLQLRETIGLPLDIVLPFWIRDEPQGEAFLARIRPAASSVTAMTYRTQFGLITQFAEPLLSWGEDHRIPVKIALEAGQVSDEVELVFAPAEKGTLAVLPDGRIDVLSDERQISGASMYRLVGRSVARAERISFLGNEHHMVETASRLAPVLSNWRSFSGFAFHGLRDLNSGSR